MTNAALRVRVKRLLSDDFCVEDLTTLFLALRDRADGREAVIEIGDFVAHREERTVGITTNATRDAFLFTRHYANIPINLSDLPSDFADLLRAAHRRLSQSVVTKETGLGRVGAGKLLTSIIDKIETHSTGKQFLPSPSTREERLIACLLRHFRSLPAFDEERLFNEFVDSLISNKLLTQTERGAFSKLKGTIALYAIASMHACTIDLADGTKARLSASADTGSGKIGVFAEAPVTVRGKPPFVNLAIFTTSLRADDHCDASLLGQSPVWTCHLELTACKTLAELRIVTHPHRCRSRRCARWRASKSIRRALRRFGYSKRSP
jgi:hypothetical protein